ncbi:MAG: hypothetical protein E3J72_14670 [Planctomycetota bacterium]|nr:MAG: hypothetical protein E3J72_14670 [Planctomycetota bacterium]
MRRVVYSSDKLVKEKDNFIWIYISHNTPDYDDWVKKYRNRTLPTVYFCTFDGKTQYKIPDVCTLNAFISKLKKLKRKNKAAWKREKKKREKKKAEEEKKAAEEKKAEEEKKDAEEKKEEDKEKPKKTGKLKWEKIDVPWNLGGTCLVFRTLDEAEKYYREYYKDDVEEKVPALYEIDFDKHMLVITRSATVEKVVKEKKEIVIYLYKYKLPPGLGAPAVMRYMGLLIPQSEFKVRSEYELRDRPKKK